MNKTTKGKDSRKLTQKERKTNSSKVSATVHKKKSKAERVFTSQGEPVYVIKMESGQRFLATGDKPKDIMHQLNTSVHLLRDQANPETYDPDKVKYVVPLYKR